jgi:hypothetical protein
MAQFRVRIINALFGYERDQVVILQAQDKSDAAAKGREIDYFADVSVLGEEGAK